MSTWRYLTHDGVGAAEGLAGDEALLLHHGRGRDGRHGAALRLYTYRSHCALVGRYQALHDEVDLDACARMGVEWGRRPTGGGAIVMGAGQLGVALATRAPASLAPQQVLERYARGIVAGLRRLGVEARFRDKNDLEVGGRKIAGLGLYLNEEGALLFHASILADLDVPLMLCVLRIPGAKLSGKAITRVEQRITTVSRETSRRLSGADLRDAVAAGFAESFGTALARSDFLPEEAERQVRLEHDRYANGAWIAQRSPRGEGRGTALLRTPAGLLRVYVGVQGDAIKSVLVAGDFNLMPPGIARLEAGLRWSHASRSRIGAATAHALDGGDELGVPAAAVAEAVWEAAARALERARGAHPVRADGSCYLPEVPA